MGPLPALPVHLPPPGRRRRRAWIANGRAHIEVRGLHRPDGARVAEALQRAVSRLDGVNWVAVDAALARVVIALDGEGEVDGDGDVDEEDLDQLIDVIEAVERDTGVEGERFPLDHPEHPGDIEPTRRQLFALAADGAGLGVALFGRLLRATPIPAELAAVATFLDNEPRVRALLESRLGTPITDLSLALANAVGQGLSHGPIGLVADIAHRANMLAESVSRRQVFLAAEQQRWGDGPPVAILSTPHPVTRPVPLPGGPIERYADRAGLAGLAAGAATLAATGDPRRAASMLMAALPKASRMGREAFAAHLCRALGLRHVLVIDHRALRRLDRVDTLVIDEGLLFEDGELSWVVTHLIQAARRQGLMVAVAGNDVSLVKRSGADLLVASGPGLAPSIRSLQTDGCVVTLLAPGGLEQAEALWGADVGLEVADPKGGVWVGDLILPQLADAAFVLDAIGTAHQLSRQSVAISLAGSATGALLGMGALSRRAPSRASEVSNVAALVSIANGTRAAVTLNRRGGRVPPQPTRWHELDVEEVLARLQSSRRGLSREEAQRRRRIIDTGEVATPSLIRSVIEEFANPLTPVLAAGAGISAAVGSVADAVMVASVSVFNSLLGGVQRFGAERAILSLSEASAMPILVRRPDGEELVLSDQLVPGDVIVLHAGDAVPADCRILEAEDLEVDESSLTGESEPVRKEPAPSFSTVLAERTSMLYEGTSIAAGEAVAVVVAIGPDTVASQLGADLEHVTSAGGVEARLRHLTSIALPVSLGGGGTVMGLGLLRGRPIQQSIGSAVALAIAAVPEGLPLLATVAQLASARRLSTRSALVRNPRAIEALGRIRVLCTDKTGTLTEGRIRLRRVSDGTRDVELDGVRLDDRYRHIVAAGLRATPEAVPGMLLPHLTDRAVVDGAAQLGVGVTDFAEGWTRVDELPFEPARGYHAVMGSWEGGRLLSVKGAPESVLERCRDWLGPNGPVQIDDEIRNQLAAEVERLARQGLRVLAVGEATLDDDAEEELTDEVVKDLTVLGFLVLSDPVRPTAAEAVQGVRRAGVEVAMVTGDHPSTAEGIAVQLGILNAHRVLTGTELAAMSDDELDAVVDDVTVYARVTPADKVRIVQALQRRGQAVAMTGDGANDAPAIRLADVGIALGAQSTPAARRAADLVVTDDRIETIVDAIIEGRAMWTSVREALAILLGGNLGEVVFTVAATAITGRAPLSARQLLAVNLLTDVAPALAIAVRPPPARTPEALLDEGPEVSLGRSLEKTIAVRAASTALGAGTAWVLASLTGGQRRASTTALIAVVGAQLGQTVVSGGRDPVVIAAGVGSFAALATLVQVPGLSQFCGCTPLDPLAWAIAFGSTALATGTSALGSALVSRVTPD